MDQPTKVVGVSIKNKDLDVNLIKKRKISTLEISMKEKNRVKEKCSLNNNNKFTLVPGQMIKDKDKAAL